MKTWKKVMLIILLVVGALFLFATISYYVSRSQEKSEIEDAFSSIESAIKENNFDTAGSIINEIDWKVFRVERGEERLKELEQKLITSEFRFEADKIKQDIKNNQIELAESRWSELFLESISNDDLTQKEKDYLNAVHVKLIETKAEAMKPFMEDAKRALPLMYEKKNEFEQTTWIKDKTSPRFVDQNAFYVYFGEEKGEYSNSITPLRLRVQYYGDNWLFHEKFKLLIDGETYTFTPNEVDRDNGNGGYVWEWSDESFKSYGGEQFVAKRMVEIINSKEAKIKFIGDKYYDIQIITQKQKDALRNVLLAYIAKGKYFKFAEEL